MPRKQKPKVANKCPRCGYWMTSMYIDPENTKQVRDEWPNAFKPWSLSDMERLGELVLEGKMGLLELAVEFGRPPKAITSRLEMLGLRFIPKANDNHSLEVQEPEAIVGKTEEELRELEAKGEI